MYDPDLTTSARVDFIVREATFALQTPRERVRERAERVARYSDAEKRFCRSVLAPRERLRTVGSPSTGVARGQDESAWQLPSVFVELLRDHRSSLDEFHQLAS
jgi:hypothetical protein